MSIKKVGIYWSFRIEAATDLRQVIQKALQWELIKINPVKEATPPRISKTRKQTWTVDEAKLFLEVCELEHYLIPAQLAIFTGMRRGEILALR